MGGWKEDKSNLPLGTVVQLKNLHVAAAYNDEQGLTVSRFNPKRRRYAVRLLNDSEKVLNVRCANFDIVETCLVEGDLIILKNFKKKPRFNGLTGSVVKILPSLRYNVKLDNGERRNSVSRRKIR